MLTSGRTLSINEIAWIAPYRPLKTQPFFWGKCQFHLPQWAVWHAERSNNWWDGSSRGNMFTTQYVSRQWAGMWITCVLSCVRVHRYAPLTWGMNRAGTWSTLVLFLWVVIKTPHSQVIITTFSVWCYSVSLSQRKTKNWEGLDSVMAAVNF